MTLHQKTPKIRFALAAGLLAVAWVSAAAAQPVKLDISQPLFKEAAGNLLEGIGKAGIDDIPAHGGYHKPRIAILPVGPEKDLITPEEAAEMHARLSAELTRQGRDKFKFVDSEALGTAPPADKKTEPGALLVRYQKLAVDIIIKSDLRGDNHAVGVSFRAIGVGNGALLAATTPRYIRLIRPFTGSSDLAQLTVQEVPVRKAVPPHPAPALQEAAWSEPPAGRARFAVHRAQRMLALLGYYAGPIDGVRRPAIRRAIRRFEKDAGLPPLGRVTRKLMRKLRRARNERFSAHATGRLGE